MVTIVAVCMVMLSMLGTSLASHSQLPTTPQFFKNLNKTYKIMNTTALAIIRPENIATIVKAAPESYNENRQSHDRCIKACKELFDNIQKQGMTDQLDQQAALFIDRSRRTLKAMNTRRSAVTMLFDEVRSAYTTIENDIDPTRPGTIPYLLQQQRDQYAARKREEELRRQREEAERQRREAARTKYLTDVEDDLKRKYDDFAKGSLDALSAIDKGITLDNIDDAVMCIKAVSTDLPDTFTSTLRTTIPLPYGIAATDAATMEQQVLHELLPKLKQQYKFDIESNRNYILDRIPSKRREFEAIDKASAAEKERLEAEKAEREKAEAARRAEEEQRKQEEEQRLAEQRKQQQQMQSLFASQATVQGYAPKTKVTKKINLLNPEGILPIISMWFANEGCKMTVEELAKKFKFAVTYCEKLANKEGTTIKDESIEYIDEVKAK